jgi:hypothetical protein
MTTKQFANWLSTIDGITVISIEKDKVYFFITKEQLVVKVTKTANESDNFLSLHSDSTKMMFCLHNHQYKKFVELFEDRKVQDVIPDLSLVTVDQMIDELKKRKNISFAFIMTEHTSVDNLSLEASGNPTFICGLLARATNLAAKYADKNINYYQSGEEIQDDEDEDDSSY